MGSQTLLAHLSRLSSQPENLATEALGFILKQSQVARQALLQGIERAGVTLPSDLAFQTQVSAEAGDRPDLCGYDPERRERLLIEAKFWAGLTENQPCAYLNRLPRELASALIFVAPDKRIESLWAEVLHACKESHSPVERATMPGWKLATLGADRYLMLTSWRATLQTLATALDSTGNHGDSSDVRQLQGLCNRMDDEAFLPLRPGEFAPEIPRRLMQLIQLVKDAIATAERQGIVSTRKLKAAASENNWGLYCRVGNVFASLRIAYWYWAQTRDTPVWVVIYGTNWQAGKLGECRGCLSDYERTVPTRLIVERERLIIPIDLPLGVEREHVLLAVVNQLAAIANRLVGIVADGQPDQVQPPTDAE